MRALATILLAMFIAIPAAEGSDAERWQNEARNVTIIRDNWGIAHIYGKSDADAVFGAIYAQAEDDFARIERNYLTNLGWLAQAEGRSAIYSDLRARLYIDPAALKRQFAASPAWLKKLMIAWADGLNFYLDRHPDAKPKVIAHFEPWMALSFTEGSIGGDIEEAPLDQLEGFYGGHPAQSLPKERPPGGSNGFAIAPALSASGHALLWINPHTSFYFRSELQMVSDEGLNSYGAVTWGQFFIYQGFNTHNGWMHTSNGGDAIDDYAETVIERQDGLYYKYGGGLRKLTVSRVTIPYKDNGLLSYRDFTVYHSHHGPIVRAENGKWIAMKILQDPVRALMQSYLRTKTTDYKSFYKTQEMRTDTSNNTVYADVDGTIAYFHGNFIPKRDPKFDFTLPVDGSDPATEWQGPHALTDTIMLLNPKNGWITNTNNWPFSAAGPESPKRENYPAYMWTRGENPRGVHADELLRNAHDLTLDGLIALAYDGHLTAFDVLLPQLFKAFDQLTPGDPLRQKLLAPIESLRGWDRRTGAESVPTAVAIFWGQALLDRERAAAGTAHQPVYDYTVANASDADRLDALAGAVAKLQQDFGGWQTKWGDINRFQHITDDIQQPFDDSKPSLPIGMAPSRWGALASFDSTPPRATRKIYGSVGNSFVAAVEFGPTIRAKAIMTGGESGDPASPHFNDQAELYREGRFRDVLFYKADVMAHAERSYRPGE